MTKPLPKESDYASYEEFLLERLAVMPELPPDIELKDDDFLLQYPPFMQPLYDAIHGNEEVRHCVLPTGRAAGKSKSVSMMLLDICMQKRTNVGCYRETQQSLKDSIYKVMSDIIISEGLLGTHFKLIPSDSKIVEVNNGSEIVFRSIQTSFSTRQKGTTLLDFIFIDEAEEISMLSIERFIPTMRDAVWRKQPLFIWAGNLETHEDPFNVYFLKDNPPPGTIVCKGSLFENPFCDAANALAAKKMLRDDPILYAHVYGGEPRDAHHLAVFHNFERWTDDHYDNLVEELNIPPLLGMDFGFVNDPCAVVELYVIEHLDVIYWKNELYQVRVPADTLASWVGGKPEKPSHLWDNIPAYNGQPIQTAVKHGFQILADSAEVEWCWHMKKQGVNIEPVSKDLIQDGLQFLQAYKNVIHRRCENTYNEFCTYKLVVDPKTGKAKVPNVPEDKNNHCIDAGRYATREYRRRKLAQTDSGLYTDVAAGAPDYESINTPHAKAADGRPRRTLTSNVHLAF